MTETPPSSSTSTQTSQLGRQLPFIVGGVGLLVLLAVSSVQIVPAGHVGVVFSALSGVKQAPRNAGLHLVLPVIETMNLYDVRLQEVTFAPDMPEEKEGSINARSKEGLNISSDVTIQFRVDRTKVADLHKKFGPNYIKTVIRPQVRSKVRASLGIYEAADLISTQRQEAEATIVKELTTVFSKSALVLDSVLLRDIRIPESVAKAIEQKQTAEQQVAVERNRLKQADIAAQRRVVEAEGEAKADVARARGEAEALALRGRALRENPQLIQLTVAEKLSPGIQTVMLPSDGNFLLDVKSLTTSTAPKATPTKKP